MWMVISISTGFRGTPSNHNIDYFNLRGDLQLRRDLNTYDFDSKIHYLLEKGWEPFSVNTAVFRVRGLDDPVTTWHFRKKFEEG